jgi:cytochrome c-type biogenesis protein CcmE
VNAPPDGFLKLREIMNLENILGMGKYAGYVWSCFAVTAVVLIANVWLARRSLAQSFAGRKRVVMTPRRRRMVLVGLVVLGVGAATAFALTAFQDNLLYFYSTSDVIDGKVPPDRTFRIGGMVTQGSVQRQPGSLEVRFVLTDYAKDVTVSYSGVLPDLFREGQGIVARGHMAGEGLFVAEEVLAKHDEKYMPPEVADSLKKQHEGVKPQTTPLSGTAAATQEIKRGST